MCEQTFVSRYCFFSHAIFSIRFLLFYRFFDRFFLNRCYNLLIVHARSIFVFSMKRLHIRQDLSCYVVFNLCNVCRNCGYPIFLNVIIRRKCGYYPVFSLIAAQR